MGHGRELVSEEKHASVPSRRGSRPWRQPRAQRTSASVNVQSVRQSLARKTEQRAKAKALSALVKANKEEQGERLAAERKRIAEKRKRKEANRLRSSKTQPITNPAKLKKMSKKQLRNLIKV